MRSGGFPVALGRDDGLDFGFGEFFADGISIIAAIRQERLDFVGDHAKERREALDVVRLSRRQNEAERTALGIAPCMEFGGEAAARSAKRLGFLSPLFMPTAQ